MLKKSIKNKTPDIRFLNDMKTVVYDKDWLKTAKNFKAYYMYRGIETKANLRYDITVIPQHMMGKEFIKTKGHYHIGAYPEIYIVLKGQAIYLMQKKGNGKEISDVFAIQAKAGDIAVIPPYYGHVTINPSKQPLQMANWVSEDCKSDYGLYEKNQGACYFYTKQGWIKNPKYSQVPDLRFEKPVRKLPENWEGFLEGKETNLAFFARIEK